MKILIRLIRLFEASGTLDRAHNGQLQLEANNLGHCAVYEKELQRVWPITEENRKAKIAEFAEKRGFRLAYYKQGHSAIFLEAPPATTTEPANIVLMLLRPDHVAASS
jgi:hypothetical protein